MSDKTVDARKGSNMDCPKCGHAMDAHQEICLVTINYETPCGCTYHVPYTIKQKVAIFTRKIKMKIKYAFATEEEYELPF